MRSLTERLMREFPPIVAGGFVTAGTLLVQHYGLRRARLQRTDAYVAGTIGYDIGFAVYLLVGKKDLMPLVGLVTTQAAGGAAVKGAYWFDKYRSQRSKDKAQLEELLEENNKLRTRIEQLQSNGLRLYNINLEAEEIVKGFKVMEDSKIIQIVIERHSDTYLAYPLGVNGAVVGEGDSADEALENVKSALREFIETFGSEVLDNDNPIMDAFLAEAKINLKPENAKISG